MATRKTENFNRYWGRNSQLIHNYLDKIAQCGVIDIKDVTIYDLAKTECIDHKPNQPLYEFKPYNNNGTKVNNYLDQPMRMPLTFESLAAYLIGRFCEYDNQTAQQWFELVQSTKLSFC